MKQIVLEIPRPRFKKGGNTIIGEEIIIPIIKGKLKFNKEAKAYLVNHIKKNS